MRLHEFNSPVGHRELGHAKDLVQLPELDRANGLDVGSTTARESASASSSSTPASSSSTTSVSKHRADAILLVRIRRGEHMHSREEGQPGQRPSKQYPAEWRGVRKR